MGCPTAEGSSSHTGQLAIFSPGLLSRPATLIDYVRISTVDQALTLHQDALTQAGCDRLFTDTAAGSQGMRPALAEREHRTLALLSSSGAGARQSGCCSPE